MSRCKLLAILKNLAYLDISAVNSQIFNTESGKRANKYADFAPLI